MKKKYYLITAILMAVIVGTLAFTVPTTKSESSKPDVGKIAEKFGFVSTKNTTELNIQRYVEQGFVAYTDQSFLDTMELYNLQIARSREYTGSIPEEKLLEMKTTYDRLSNYDDYFEYVYRFSKFGQSSREKNRYDEFNEVIYIAAPANELSVDPIIAVKIKGGWVQLARW